MLFNVPPTTWLSDLRKGQTLFIFLEWLAETKGYSTEQSNRMADPFHIEDDKLGELYLEFLKTYKK